MFLWSDFKVTDISYTHILNFYSFKSSQLCKLYLIYIVTCMCCNHCNIRVMTFLKAMGQGHILTYTLKVHNLGELNLANLANLIQLTPKIDTYGISGVFWWTEYIYLKLCWDLLGISSIVKNAKKRAEGFWFGVNFIHFCLSVFYVNLFLENHPIFSHEILYNCSWYDIGGQYTQTIPPGCCGQFWGIFGAYFGICTYLYWYLFNILSWNFVQVFLA